LDSQKLLSQVVPGEIGVIFEYLDSGVATKLLSMGVLPGSKIEVRRFAPWGGGMIIKVDELVIALRKDEAETIAIK
jgi:ferrous iron transport protein A